MSNDTSRANAIPLVRNWWGAFYVCFFVIGSAAYSIWSITWPAVRAGRLGQPLPGDWTWTTVIGLDALLAGLALFMCQSVLIQVKTVLTDEGIYRPKLFKHIFIRWSEVTSVTKNINTVEIRGMKHKIGIVLYLFKDRDRLIAVIREHAPKDAFLLE